jgi:hypothetical protein
MSSHLQMVSENVCADFINSEGETINYRASDDRRQAGKQVRLFHQAASLLDRIPPTSNEPVRFGRVAGESVITGACFPHGAKLKKNEPCGIAEKIGRNRVF